MPRFLIEVEHEAEASACDRAAQVLFTSGSHWLTHADWGCLDGVHAAWLIVEVETRELARAIVPPVHRSRARVIGLSAFSLAEIDTFLAHHRRALRAA